VDVASVIAFEALEECDLDAWLEEQKARDGGGPWIRCAHCAERITTTDQRIHQAGAHEHGFENPAGIAYRIGCFRHAPGCRTEGEPTLAWTWFPGHAWSVALCSRCGSHLGWSYGPGGTGNAFYGLILDRLNEEM